ncbi:MULTISPECIES: hypothetical protein [unclassified Streptomyces]|uniref:hypothetical protein n=1 Tax=unclassified Streptomyces TaxID=2593676 RepID=UPI0027E429EE|nr:MULTISPECIES: hypothetical protein [unclassified Streptomyces]MCH0566642.1 hypothetical protein [Streptomyces sp. MUM 2J]MCH0572832.1 hypothetical protein [Streptomyces sp. MUM 136J]
MTSAAPPADPRAARGSLDGPAFGGALGERWFPLLRDRRRAFAEIRARRTPPEPERNRTDDTATAGTTGVQVEWLSRGEALPAPAG